MISLTVSFRGKIESKMEIVCRGCGKPFDGKGEKFCNNVCRDSHIDKLEKIVIEATKNDSSHTKKLSRD